MRELVSLQGVVIVVGFAISAAVFARLIAGLRRDGGQVCAAPFGLPDLLAALGLATLFAALVALSLRKPDVAETMTVGKLIASGMTFAAIVFALCAFLSFRRIPLVETFGLARLAAHRVFGTAVLILISAFPLVFLAGWIFEHWLKNQGSEQDMVKLFRSAATSGNYGMMITVFVTGILLAPICEELLFRGYFYGVGKRFAGPWISGALSSLLFAAFHGNLASLPGLLTLAIILNLAYERTGSIAVPMTIHALFNGTSLCILYLQSIGRLGV